MQFNARKYTYGTVMTLSPLHPAIRANFRTGIPDFKNRQSTWYYDAWCDFSRCLLILVFDWNSVFFLRKIVFRNAHSYTTKIRIHYTKYSQLLSFFFLWIILRCVKRLFGQRSYRTKCRLYTYIKAINRFTLLTRIRRRFRYYQGLIVNLHS